MTSAPQPVSADPELLDALPSDDQRFLSRARRLAAKLPFLRDTVAMWYAVRDSRTPFWAKSMIVAAIAYFMLPMDMVPDFIAGLGFTDDAAVVLTTLRTIREHIKPSHYADADAFFGISPENNEPL